MRLFVSEYLCSGAWPEPVLPPSLAREGRAMLRALLTDLAALPEVTLCTTWDAQLGELLLEAHRLPSVGLVESIVTSGATDEAAVFQRLARECDATYVIAPELDDLLTRRVQSVLDAGGRSLNASPAAISVCSDKWETFQQLSAAGIATVPTALFDTESSSLPFNFPLVLKPRFGAGSQQTFLIRNEQELEAVSELGGRGSCRAASHAKSSFKGGSAGASPSRNVDSETEQLLLSRQQSAVSHQQNPKSKIQNPKSILQPYIPGRPLAVAAIVRSDGTLREHWPVGEQILSEDGRFTYLGGYLPADRIDGAEITRLISEVIRGVPGLRGYIGIDLILRDDDRTPLVVDINPRLTTSYLGYRALADGNLAGRILWPDGEWPTVGWRGEFVGFDAGGHVIRPPAGFGSEWR